MESLIVLLIVATAAFYAGRSFLGNFRGKGSCGCGEKKGGCASGKTLDKIRELAASKH